MITIKDVAELAGVSPATVSNALTGTRPVAEGTRRRVLQAAERLGSQPNLLARSLVSSRSQTLGVVTCGLQFHGPSRTVVGVKEQAEQLGYSLLLHLVRRPEDTDVDPILNRLAGRRVDGIVWAVPEVGGNRSWIRAQRLKRLPPIVFLSMAPRPGLAVVAVDNRAGARMAVEHLLGQGRRIVGVITGPMNWWEARERYAGWEAALDHAGLPTRDSLKAEGDWSPQSGEQCLRDLLERCPDIDAVSVGNDRMALGALRAAHLLGRRVPDDLAVVGFDNISESAFFWPALTTISYQLSTIGRLAVQELHRIIEAGSEEQPDLEQPSILLGSELIVRDSSCAQQMAARR